jgi:hypothetical protein
MKKASQIDNKNNNSSSFNIRLLLTSSFHLLFYLSSLSTTCAGLPIQPDHPQTTSISSFNKKHKSTTISSSFIRDWDHHLERVQTRKKNKKHLTSNSSHSNNNKSNNNNNMSTLRQRKLKVRGGNAANGDSILRDETKSSMGDRDENHNVVQTPTKFAPVVTTQEYKPSRIRGAVFPIYGKEVKKFLLMGSIKFFVIMALTLTRDTKDTLVVTQCGAEAIAFLKV